MAAPTQLGVAKGGRRSGRCLVFWKAGLAPQHLGDLDRIQSQAAPPGSLIAATVCLPVVQTAERNRELIAHLAAQRADLGEAQVVRLRGFSASE
jgi:hypothetical protein